MNFEKVKEIATAVVIQLIVAVILALAGIIGGMQGFFGERVAAFFNVTPVGTVLAYPGPVGGTTHFESIYGGEWMPCDGRVLKRLEYPNLYKAIEQIYGKGNVSGDSEFNLPDYQGYFLRGKATTEEQDPDLSERISPVSNDKNTDVGSTQTDAFQNHVHLVQNRGTEELRQAGPGDRPQVLENNPSRSQDGFVTQSIVEHPTTGIPRFSSETRPKNVYVNWIIKVK